jgi:hypothetical protein
MGMLGGESKDASLYYILYTKEGSAHFIWRG